MKKFVITAYSADEGGSHSKHCITASGRIAVAGRTIAAPSNIPIGTHLYIPALHRTYIVEDRGGSIKGNKLDLFVANAGQADRFGRKTLDVVVYA
ncbi:3D domain-containing protein [Aneurinibacillus sp. Ricciae_BoGa-3]|uniref:3D domain-containing protein n=1 Tax=Aneurinibacillus sp. Ricciae_BoGa-3 TaxID=3022697 RepID=UPI002341381F|nr:3D domain-containing protein [Aneurinibacillus sp. Ricciae_BoGa-3]WCK53402.1 3D domain-containing protein [Aneurinibacillus sp. Ricciae_BoGa-3]